MKETNIAFFVTCLDSGGIENYLLRFIKSKYSNFNDIYIFCKSGRGGQLENEFEKIENVVIVKKKINYFNYKGINKLKTFFSESSISIVCDFTGNFAGIVLMSAYIAGINKRVAFYRGSTDRFESGFLRNTYNNLVKQLVRKYATDVLSNSKAAFNYFFPKDWQYDPRFSVIYNGIDSKEFTNQKENLRSEFGIPNEAFVIGHTGRYNSAKNHDVILSVAVKLVQKYDDIYFILCGNGVKDNLQEWLKNKGFDRRILVFNNRNDIPKFLNTMNCYFFPSITEGQPNALIEAMVMGLPYVASNIEPIKETVIEYSNLYNYADITSFVKALEEKYLKRVGRDTALQKKAIEKFNADKCFEFFFERLVV